jgi:hypothetical protein
MITILALVADWIIVDAQSAWNAAEVICVAGTIKWFTEL